MKEGFEAVDHNEAVRLEMLKEHDKRIDLYTIYSMKGFSLA